jgi:glyoxylate reductase
MAGRRKASRRHHPQAAGPVETRMRELFDAQAESRRPADEPAGAGRRGPDGRRAGADRHRPIDAALIEQAGPNLKLIANFGNGVDNIDVAAAASAASP